MTGTTFQLETQGMERVRAVFDRLENPNLRPLLDALGAEGETQTRRRIQEEKTAPGGTPWAPWSPPYAKSRHGGQGLLQAEGHLLDSIQYEVIGDDTVGWGSNLIYAAIHQFGGADVGSNIPARPWLGLSTENSDDLDGILTDWAEELLQ